MVIAPIVSLLIVIAMACFIIFQLGTMIYYICMTFRVKKKCKQLRQQIFEKYGVWIEEEPMM
jgi:hypothetical protein